MVARAGEAIVFLQAVSQGSGRGRPSRPSLPRSTALAPTYVDELFVGLMRMRADKSAMGAINRPLRLICSICQPSCCGKGRR